jgi:hypothetical protein
LYLRNLLYNSAMTTKPKRQPEDAPKMGRPLLTPGGRAMPTRQVRIDDERWEKLRVIAGEPGAGQWIRDRIDEAPDPGESPAPPKRRS